MGWMEGGREGWEGMAVREERVEKKERKANLYLPIL